MRRAASRGPRELAVDSGGKARAFVDESSVELNRCTTRVEQLARLLGTLDTAHTDHGDLASGRVERDLDAVSCDGPQGPSGQTSSLVGVDLASHDAIVVWLSAPMNTALAILLVAVTAYHSSLGVQVVIEDYVHGHGLKIVSLVLSRFAHVFVAALSIYAILRIGLGA